MRVIVDHERCAATGMCESFAPEVFDVNDDGLLTLLNDRPSAELHDKVRSAAEACPVEAIEILE